MFFISHWIGICYYNVNAAVYFLISDIQLKKQKQNITPPWPISLNSVDYKDPCSAVASFPTVLAKFSEKVISILLEMKILFGEDS